MILRRVRRVNAAIYFVLDYVQTYDDGGDDDDDDDDDEMSKQRRFGQHEPCYVSVI
jgi:hypothetical protein